MAKTPKKTDGETPKDETSVDENDLNISVDGDNEAPGAPGASGNGEQAATDEAASGPMLSVLAQYTKDMSFENPNAPDSLRSGQQAPEVNIDLRIGRHVNKDNTVEISLLIKAHAMRGEQTVFLAELDYAGLFAIQNVDMEQIQPLMMIECPRLLFPYARKILADMTQDGGHMPIMLDMPDFPGMFRDEMMRRAQEQGLN